jgi:hypothetical protein
MLSNKDLYEEIVSAEKTRDDLKSDYEKAMLKMAILQVKLSHNLRTNIVSVMKFLKIPLVEPKQDREQVER